MDNLLLTCKKSRPQQTVEIQLPASKSITNRLLILQRLYFPNLTIKNKSQANDSLLLEKLLQESFYFRLLDAQDAGTTFRFLTALLASTPSDCVLTGTERMKQRPVRELVTMLKQAGAEIVYLEKEGFPPLKIRGKQLDGGIVIQSGSITSSQFYSAMAMIAPCFRKGLTLHLPPNMGSKPYWDMTLACMKQLGLSWENQPLSFYKFTPFAPSQEPLTTEVEKDWSAASFFVLLPLLIKDSAVHLPNLTIQSLQGDAHFLLRIAADLGLIFIQEKKGITVKNTGRNIALSKADFSDAPDLSLNFIVLMALLKKPFRFSGLESLAIKESDRTAALQTELAKAGVKFYPEGKDWVLDPSGLHFSPGIAFETYNDHRIAMALSYFGIFTPTRIHNPHVVNKSFPNFWEEVDKTILTTQTG